MLVRLKFMLSMLGLLLLTAVVLIFVLENRQQSHLILFGWLTPEFLISILISVAFMLGVAVSLLFNLWLISRFRLRIARQQFTLRTLPKDIGPPR